MVTTTKLAGFKAASIFKKLLDRAHFRSLLRSFDPKILGTTCFQRFFEKRVFPKQWLFSHNCKAFFFTIDKQLHGVDPRKVFLSYLPSRQIFTRMLRPGFNTMRHKSTQFGRVPSYHKYNVVSTIATYV